MPRLQSLRPTLQTLKTGPALTLNPSSWRGPEASSAKRGYDYAWQKRRAAQLAAEPLCAYCRAEGRTTAATVADHITPHRGDPQLFRGPLQSLCATCHSGRKQREEREPG